MGSAPSVLGGSARDLLRQGSKNKGNFNDDDDKIKLSKLHYGNRNGRLSSALNEYLGTCSDKDTKDMLIRFQRMMGELINGGSKDNSSLPVRKITQTLIKHTSAILEAKKPRCGIFLDNQIVEPSSNDSPYGLVSTIEHKIESHDTTKEVLPLADFLSLGQKICEDVQETKRVKTRVDTLKEQMLTIIAVPIFEYCKGELEIEFESLCTFPGYEEALQNIAANRLSEREDEEEEEEKRQDDDEGKEEEEEGDNLKTNKQADSDSTPGNQANTSRVGAVLVICFVVDDDDNSKEKDGTNEKNSNSRYSFEIDQIAELAVEAGGFLKQSIENEARQEHLFQTQRSLAAAMDTAHLFALNEDILKAIHAYQQYIELVASVRGCYFFQIDDSAKQLWHKRVDGSVLRLPFANNTVAGRSVNLVKPVLWNGEQDDELDLELQNQIDPDITIYNALCIPLLSELDVMGVVMIANKYKEIVSESNRKAVEKGNTRSSDSTAGKLFRQASSRSTTAGSSFSPANAPSNSKVTRGQSFVDKLDGGMNLNNNDQNESSITTTTSSTASPYKTPIITRADDRASFTRVDMDLLSSTVEEFNIALEDKKLELTYHMSKDGEKNKDLTSLLAMYDPLRRQTLREAKKLGQSPSQSEDASSAVMTEKESSEQKSASKGTEATAGHGMQNKQDEDARIKSKAMTTVLPQFSGEDVAVIEGKLKSWDLDPLVEDGDNLIYYSVHLFEQFDLLSKFSLERSNLVSFLNEVKANYFENPYHNWAHAFSVLHGTANMLRLGVVDLLKVPDVMALFIAAICHDIGHPGTNNDFQINSNSQLALTYNDISVLENFHASLTFKVLQTENCNLLHSSSFSSRQAIREAIVKAILSTDISLHFKLVADLKARHHEALQSSSKPQPISGRKTIKPSVASNAANSSAGKPKSPNSANGRSRRMSAQSHLSSFKRKMTLHSARRQGSIEGNDEHANQVQAVLSVHAKEVFDKESRADRMMVVEAVLHTSDLSNPVLPFPLYRKWSLLVVEEFYTQAINEQKLGLPTQPHMANPPSDEKSLAKLQMNFIDYVVAPLWSVMKDIFPALTDRHSTLESNREQWKTILETLEAEEELKEQDDEEEEEAEEEEEKTG